MNKLGLLVAGIMAALSINSIASPLAGQDLLSPVGNWKTIDDRTGKPRSLVQIYLQDGKLFGRIERSLNTAEVGARCTKCTDDRKNQLLSGMVIMRNLQAEGDKFVAGDIIDPDSGTVYRCEIRLSSDGHTLVVRGYVGMPWLGRSQSWERE